MSHWAAFVLWCCLIHVHKYGLHIKGILDRLLNPRARRLGWNWIVSQKHQESQRWLESQIKSRKHCIRTYLHRTHIFGTIWKDTTRARTTSPARKLLAISTCKRTPTDHKHSVMQYNDIAPQLSENNSIIVTLIDWYSHLVLFCSTDILFPRWNKKNVFIKT